MLIIFLILGLIVGSFLNVVIYRLSVAENFTTGRSKCPHCQKMIRWYDNIPLVSFVILNAKCRNCQKPISWQYPLVEFFTGILFVLVGMKFFALENMQTWTATGYFLGVVSFLVIIFVYDLLHMEIPNLVIWIAVFWSAIFNLILDWENKILPNSPLDLMTYSGVLAGVCAFVFFFLLVIKSKEKWMGLGDAYLVIFLGLFLGWPNILLALFLAFSSGAIVGLLMVAIKRKGMRSPIPFAPFLVAGSIVAMFWGNQIVEWYWNLI